MNATRPVWAAFLLALGLFALQLFSALAAPDGTAAAAPDAADLRVAGWAAANPPKAPAEEAAPDTLSDCSWSSAPAVPAPILDAPSVTVGANIYVFGGVSGGAVSANAYKFDGSTWTPIASLPVALEFASVVTDGTNVYILGGADVGGTPQNTLYRYNVASNTYTTLAPFTTGTWNQASVIQNNKIYKFCGTNSPLVSTNMLEIYDVASNSWTTGAPYPLALSFVNAFARGDFIYAAGGLQSISGPSAKTYRYDPVSNIWDDAAIADLPAPRWGAAAANYQGDGILAGGYVAGTATENISATVTAWDAASNTWQTITNMLAARARMTGAVLSGSFYVFGGRCTTAGVCDVFQGTTDNQKLLCLNAPVLLSAVSRKTHGGAGSYDLPLPAAGPVGVESRQGSGASLDAHQVVATFEAAVSVGGVSVQSNNGLATASASVVGSTVTINLSSVTNPQRLTILLTGVNDGTRIGDVSIQMGVLLGDVNGNGSVNATDIGQTKSQSGVTLSLSNFRSDVVPNGSINATDVSVVKSRSGSMLPP
ncbi:MAG: kelch repeat-containing protein [Chthoniobacterales bacterium]